MGPNAESERFRIRPGTVRSEIYNRFLVEFRIGSFFIHFLCIKLPDLYNSGCNSRAIGNPYGVGANSFTGFSRKSFGRSVRNPSTGIRLTDSIVSFSCISLSFNGIRRKFPITEFRPAGAHRNERGTSGTLFPTYTFAECDAD